MHLQCVTEGYCQVSAWNKHKKVTDISFNPSLQPSKGHKSIGSSGSFWLPPKMKAGSFDASIKSFSSTSPNPNGAQPKLQNLPLSVTQNSSLHSAPYSKHLNSEFAERSNKPINEKLASPKIFSTPKQNNGLTQIQEKILRGGARMHIQENGNSTILQDGVPITKLTVSSFSAKVSSQVTIKNSDGQLSVFSNSASSGTGNAVLNNLNEHKTQIFQDETKSSKQDRSRSFTEENLVNEIKEVLITEPFHTFYKNGVARFAFSMDNGDSVSVRIQQMKDSFQICFICEDKKSLHSLHHKFSSFNQEINAKNISAQFHFFNSYKQMDDVISPTKKLS